MDRALKKLQSLDLRPGDREKHSLKCKTQDCWDTTCEIKRFFSSNPVKRTIASVQKPSAAEVLSDTPQTVRSCTVCKSPASKYCSACPSVDIHGSQFKRGFYCSTACQVSDWPNHKGVCKTNRRSVLDQRSLYRAADFLQNAYFTFRKSAYDLSADIISVNENRVTVIEGEYDTVKVLSEFPEALVHGKKPWVRRMMYSLLACSDQFSAMHELCKAVLKEPGFTKKIEEIHFYIKPGPREWTLLRSNGDIETSNDSVHCAYRITLRNGTKYGLDLSGAQFGHEKHLMLWDEFEQQRILAFQRICAFGTFSTLDLQQYQPFTEKSVRGGDSLGIRNLVMCVINQLAGEFTKGFHYAMRVSKTDMKALLALEDQEKCEKDMTTALLCAWTWLELHKEDQMKQGGFLQVIKTA